MTHRKGISGTPATTESKRFLILLEFVCSEVMRSRIAVAEMTLAFSLNVRSS